MTLGGHPATLAPWDLVPLLAGPVPFVSMFPCFDFAGTSTVGCSAGTRAGFTAVNKYPTIAACPGTVKGHHVSDASRCAPGWHVCTGVDVFALSITFAEATSFSGCYAFDSNNDCQGCFPTCREGPASASINGRGCDVAGPTDPDLHGMGRDCGYAAPDEYSCLRDGRLFTNNPGCSITVDLSGSICCKDAPGPPSASGPPDEGVAAPAAREANREKPFELRRG